VDEAIVTAQTALDSVLELQASHDQSSSFSTKADDTTTDDTTADDTTDDDTTADDATADDTTAAGTTGFHSTRTPSAVHEDEGLTPQRLEALSRHEVSECMRAGGDDTAAHEYRYVDDARYDA